MARAKLTDRPVGFKTWVPRTLALAVEARLEKDSLSGKIKYGAKSALVIRLLRRWIKETEQIHPVPEGMFDDLLDTTEEEDEDAEES